MRTHTNRMRNLVTFYIDKGALVAIPIAGIVFMGILFIFVVCTFFLASFVDPGIYPRGECVCVCVFEFEIVCVREVRQWV